MVLTRTLTTSKVFNASGGDDSAALQAMIDGLPSSGADQGGQIILPDKTYRLNSGLVSAIQNLELIGFGGRGHSRGLGGSPDKMGRTTIVVADGVTGLTWGTDNTFLSRGPVLRNIHWTADQASAAYGTRALLMYQPSNWLIDNCSFSGFNWSIGAATISDASYSAGTITFTTSGAHGFSVGDLVQVLSVVTSPTQPNGYNACRKVLTVADTTHFTVSTTDINGDNDPGTYSSGGSAYALGHAVKIAKESGASTAGATSYGNIRDSSFASDNGLGGLWLDHVIGVRITNCNFDGKNNVVSSVPTFGAAVVITGKGGGQHRIIGSNLQGYQTLLAISNGEGGAIIGTRGECFGVGLNIHAPDIMEVAGSWTNGGSGGGGTLANVGPGGINFQLRPAAPLRASGLASRYTVSDAAAGASFRDNGDEVIGTMLADITVNNSATLVAATGAAFQIGNSATEVWWFEVDGIFSATSTTPDLKATVTVPSGAVAKWGPLDVGGGSFNGFGAYATGASPIQIFAAGSTDASGSANLSWGKRFGGFIFGGGTAGLVQFRFAQNTADPTDLKMLAGSAIRARRVRP